MNKYHQKYVSDDKVNEWIIDFCSKENWIVYRYEYWTGQLVMLNRQLNVTRTEVLLRLLRLATRTHFYELTGCGAMVHGVPYESSAEH